MIRLATCFSGIGAIEHALNRMGIDNKIVFACDNGDIDILSKNIPLDISEMEEEFNSLTDIIDNIDVDEYRDELKADLKKDSELFKKQKEKLRQITNDNTNNLKNVLSSIVSMPNIKKARMKEYSSFLKKLNTFTGINENLYTLSYAVEVTNDFHKDNIWDSIRNREGNYNSSDGIECQVWI